MNYAGLTTSDKPALLEAKARGAEWVARDMNMAIYGYGIEPTKTMFGWWCDISICSVEYLGTMETLSFVGLHEKVNIDLALAQIAEMESKQKELLSEKASEKGCLTNRDKWMQLWNESDEILARQFVQQEWYGTQWCVYMFSEEPISRHDKWEDAIQAAITALHSPYTEGETK